jgi:hypothetical protein
LSHPKPVVSEYEYVCALGELYNLTCGQIWNAPKPYEEEFLKKSNVSLPQSTSYIIEPKTHRIWLTSPQNPQEVSPDLLGFYKKSMQFYIGKPFTHHFWCNNKNLIPKTIATIQSFNVPVIIHEISEIQDSFITEGVYAKFLNEDLFSFASNIARQEILLQYGGLYADIGMEQLVDLDPYFKHYEWILFTWQENSLWDGFVAIKKSDPVLKNSLTLLQQLPQILRLLPVVPTPITLTGLITFHLWRIFSLQMQPHTKIICMNQNLIANEHGFASWYGYLNTLSIESFSLDKLSAVQQGE